MYKCLKCDEVVTDGSRICRKCGSIIDELPDAVEESLVVAEPVEMDHAVNLDEPSVDPEYPPETGKQWQCSHCSADVPLHFLICWRCQHPRNEPQPGQAPQSAPGPEAPVDAELAEAKLICPKCSADQLVPNARVHVVAGGRLQVTLEPDDTQAEGPGLLSANVCERCGYVELRAWKL